MSKELVKPVKEQVSKEDLNKVESFLEKYENVTETGLAIGKLLTDYLRLKESELSLLSANAELSFENMKLKQALRTISELKYLHLSYSEEDATCMNDIATKALEELK